MAGRNNHTQNSYGPLYKSAPEVAAYVRLSEDAARIYLEDSSQDKKLIGDGHNWVYHLLLENSMNLSFAIRTLATWAKPNEAMMLLRTRLEQLIVCSYLIHEDEEVGIKRFVSYLPKVDPGFGHTLQKVDLVREGIDLLFPEMGAHIPKLVEKMDASAAKSFEMVDGQFRRKWTSFSIEEIVKRRDSIVDRNDLISSYRLGYYFDTIHKLAASLVHADVASISPAFVVLDADGTVKPHEIYVMGTVLINAHMDIIQCHEVSKRLDLLNEKKYLELFENYLKQVKMDFGIRSSAL